MDTIYLIKAVASDNGLLNQSHLNNAIQNYCCHYWPLLIIIIIIGIIGGLINYLYLNPSESEKLKVKKFYIDKTFYYHVLLGICGASLIPLFLYLTSSKLFTQCDDCYFVYFVFAGYCFVGAIFARSILDNFSNKIFNLKKEQDKQKQEIQDVKKDIQNDIDSSIMPEDIVPKQKKSELKDKITPIFTKGNFDIEDYIKTKADSEMTKVLDTLQNSNYKYFTLSAISKRSEVPENNVFLLFKAFEKASIIELVTIDNKEYWKLTKKGKDFKFIE